MRRFRTTNEIIKVKDSNLESVDKFLKGRCKSREVFKRGDGKVIYWKIENYDGFTFNVSPGHFILYDRVNSKFLPLRKLQVKHVLMYLKPKFIIS